MTAQSELCINLLLKLHVSILRLLDSTKIDWREGVGEGTKIEEISFLIPSVDPAERRLRPSSSFFNVLFVDQQRLDFHSVVIGPQ